MYIYILRLRNNKYYVGKTIEPLERFSTHLDKLGSEWTRRHSVIEVHEVIPDCDEYDEDKYTLKYMVKYGVDNVRGGSFCRINLSKSDLKTINKMILGLSDKCYKCKQSGHFIKNCKSKTRGCKQPDNFIKNCKSKTRGCMRCGRDNHIESDCYAKTNINTNEVLWRQYTSEKMRCLGDAVQSIPLHIVPHDIVQRDLSLIQSSDDHDNSITRYEDDKYTYTIKHSRYWVIFYHICDVVATKIRK